MPNKIERRWQDLLLNLIEADPDDDKFVDCAVACNARFVVTDDNHFDVLKRVDFPKIDVIGLDDIIQQIK